MRAPHEPRSGFPAPSPPTGLSRGGLKPELVQFYPLSPQRYLPAPIHFNDFMGPEDPVLARWMVGSSKRPQRGSCATALPLIAGLQPLDGCVSHPSPRRSSRRRRVPFPTSPFSRIPLPGRRGWEERCSENANSSPGKNKGKGKREAATIRRRRMGNRPFPEDGGGGPGGREDPVAATPRPFPTGTARHLFPSLPRHKGLIKIWDYILLTGCNWQEGGERGGGKYGLKKNCQVNLCTVVALLPN